MGERHTHALEVKQAWKAALDSLAGDFDVKTSWGFPSADPPKRWAYVGNVEWEESEWVTNRSRNETFTIHTAFNFQSFASKDGEDAEVGVLAYATVAEKYLADNPKLGLDFVIDSNFVPMKLGSWPVTDAQEAQYHVAVTFKTRL